MQINTYSIKRSEYNVWKRVVKQFGTMFEEHGGGPVEFLIEQAKNGAVNIVEIVHNPTPSAWNEFEPGTAEYKKREKLRSALEKVHGRSRMIKRTLTLI